MKVTLKNVTKKYGSTTAVNNFSAELPDGQLICLLGPSGCGKSTLLNMMCGITDVTEGSILFDGKDVTKVSPDKRNIGMVFQNYALYPHMTVLENICFPLEIKKIPKQERIQKAEEIAKLVHIDTLLKRYPAELSGGQQQRVAIARALVKSPELLLMDEPLSNLDARLRLEMREEIRRIQKETGVTTVFVTHDQEEAMSISDSILLMKDGFFVQEGLCQNLYVNPVNKFVSDFIGNPPVNNIPCTVKEIISAEKIVLNIENTSCEIKLNVTPKEQPAAGQKLILAVRPESFVLNEKPGENTFAVKADRISEMGKDRIVYANPLSKDMNSSEKSLIELRTILSSDYEIAEGQEINLSLKQKGVFLFEEETGKRLA